MNFKHIQMCQSVTIRIYTKLNLIKVSVLRPLINQRLVLERNYNSIIYEPQAIVAAKTAIYNM